MAIRKIARLGHPILRVPADEVPISLIQSDDIQRIISDMHETVLDADGAGLAAPQVLPRLKGARACNYGMAENMQKTQ